VATGTNDGDAQSMAEAEDMLCRAILLLWAKLHGVQADSAAEDYYYRALQEVKRIPAIALPDPVDGFDAVDLNESANLGPSNARSVVQAYQLKENFCEMVAS
jgi:hypothetical protein